MTTLRFKGITTTDKNLRTLITALRLAAEQANEDLKAQGAGGPHDWHADPDLADAAIAYRDLADRLERDGIRAILEVGEDR